MTGAGARAAQDPEPERRPEDVAGESTPSDTRVTADEAARALQRAASLHARRWGGDGTPDMTMEDVVALGDEIGLAAEDVRAAVALEKIQPVDPRKRFLGVAGPSVVNDQRIVEGDPAAVGALLEEWVKVAHCMRLVSRTADSARWEPTSGFAGAMRRGARIITGEPVLENVRGATTRIQKVDANRSAVAIEVDPGSRSKTVLAAGIAVAAGVVLGVGLPTMSGLFLGLIPVGIAIGVGILVQRRRRVAAARRHIERLMSGVEHGERPPSALQGMRWMGLGSGRRD